MPRPNYDLLKKLAGLEMLQARRFGTFSKNGGSPSTEPRDDFVLMLKVLFEVLTWLTNALTT